MLHCVARYGKAGAIKSNETTRNVTETAPLVN